MAFLRCRRRVKQSRKRQFGVPCRRLVRELPSVSPLEIAVGSGWLGLNKMVIKIHIKYHFDHSAALQWPRLLYCCWIENEYCIISTSHWSLELQFWETAGKDGSFVFFLLIVLKQKKNFVIISLRVISITGFWSKSAACCWWEFAGVKNSVAHTGADEFLHFIHSTIHTFHSSIFVVCCLQESLFLLLP